MEAHLSGIGSWDLEVGAIVVKRSRVRALLYTYTTYASYRPYIKPLQLVFLIYPRGAPTASTITVGCPSFGGFERGSAREGRGEHLPLYQPTASVLALGGSPAPAPPSNPWGRGRGG